MTDLISAVQARSELIRATVVTRSFHFEGEIHCPKLGKGGRLLSNLLNSGRPFIAMTNVRITDRSNGSQDPKIYPFIEINVPSIEFVYPQETTGIGTGVDEAGNEADQDSIS